MMKVLFLLPILACVLTVGQGEILGKCAVARKFKELGLDGFKGISLANWVCTASHESGFNTDAVHHNSYDGSTDYGILQINNRYWCKDPNYQSSNLCNIDCSALLSNNLAPSVNCAKIVVEKSHNGMEPWVAWRNHCKGRDLSQYVAGCGV